MGKWSLPASQWQKRKTVLPGSIPFASAFFHGSTLYENVCAPLWGENRDVP